MGFIIVFVQKMDVDCIRKAFIQEVGVLRFSLNIFLSDLKQKIVTPSSRSSKFVGLKYSL